jgi:hypothetical protein
MRSGKRAILARAKFSIRPGKSAAVRLRVSKADGRRLAHRSTPVTFELTAQKTKVNATLRG